MLICIAAYLPLVANNLTNTLDGLWQPTFYAAGGWELSIGRWGWVIFDAFRGGYATQPFNAIFTFLLIIPGLLLSFSIFEWDNHYVLYIFLFLISTTVCCYLSYTYMSPTFGAATLTPAIAVWLLVKNFDSKRMRALCYLMSTVLLVATLSLYQANIGCFAITSVVYAMYKLLKNERKNALSFLLKAIIIAIIACLIYKVLWDAALLVSGISAAGFKGANSLSIVGILKRIPKGIILAYKSFFTFYSFGMGYYIFRYLRIVLFVIVILIAIYKGVKRLRKDIISLLLYLVLLAIIPLASNVYYLLVADNVKLMMQMTGSLSLVLPLLFCFIDLDLSKIKRIMLICFSVIFLFGNIIAVGTDMEAMKQGMSSSMAIMNTINNTLVREDLLKTDYEYAFIGRISDSPLFRKNELWDRANEYAKVGFYTLYHDCIMYSYDGLIDDMGINLKTVDIEEYENILKDEQTIQNMTVYPDDGSIIKKDNTIIIKVSDTYKIGE